MDGDLWDELTKLAVKTFGPRIMRDIHLYWVLHYQVVKLNRYIEKLKDVPDGRVIRVRMQLIRDRDICNHKKVALKDELDQMARCIPIVNGDVIASVSPWEQLTMGGFRRARYNRLRKYRNSAYDELEYYLLRLYYYGQDDMEVPYDED